MNSRTLVVIGLAALAAPAIGCKAKTSVPDTTHAATVAPAPSPAAGTTEAPFEGEIQVSVYEPLNKTPKTIAYDVKGDKVRSQSVVADGTIAEVMGDRKDKKAYEVLDASKAFVAVDVGAGRTATPTVTRTGKMEQVLGHSCEDWTITDDGERIDVCVAKGIAYIDPAAGTGEPAWAGVLTKEHAFPLRMTATGKDGKQEFRAEATKIEARKLDDGLFKVPADYHAMADTQTLKVVAVP